MPARNTAGLWPGCVALETSGEAIAGPLEISQAVHKMYKRYNTYKTYKKCAAMLQPGCFVLKVPGEA